MASVAPENTALWAMASSSLKFHHISPYVANHVRITGRGNVYKICPGRVTLGSCLRAADSVISQLFWRCLQVVIAKRPAILFPEKRIKIRSSMTTFSEIAKRNTAQTTIACHEKLKHGKIWKFSKLPKECSHAIVRDLIYEKHVSLIGTCQCTIKDSNTSVLLLADKPLKIRLDGVHEAYIQDFSSHFFTTDGSHILFFKSLSGLEQHTEVWIAKKIEKEHIMALENLMNEKQPYVKPNTRKSWSDSLLEVMLCPPFVVTANPATCQIDKTTMNSTIYL
ncbi:hypothetical protein GcC1_098015 [Golovinomyces cichoracearum]|uniref:Uncharacterized protein n=1 Tax=Golovinomyces cichoracearum TaxID=62708 RepID=A0A420IAK4_9PEZI|nr:hypothetical protein GcC1_098015 [Golovinomyces cichoracearum]